jgi:mRNA-degrading endonuclease RelE of RelBE toxin-antitoxin system
MKSDTLPTFWREYYKLSPSLKEKTRKAFRLWQNNPHHPSLRFERKNTNGNVWSVSISRGFRALCVIDNDTAIWFWIGDHDSYERIIANWKQYFRD